MIPRCDQDVEWTVTLVRAPGLARLGLSVAKLDPQSLHALRYAFRHALDTLYIAHEEDLTWPR